MTGVYDENVEQAIRERLHDYEATRQAAEQRLITVQHTIEEADRAIAHISFFLEDYRKAHGLPPRSDKPSPVLATEYSHLGPTDLVQYWADKHGGDVVVKELARVAVNAGIFDQYRNAASSIYGVLKRKPFDKVEPGHFKRQEFHTPVNGYSLPWPTAISMDDVDDLPLDDVDDLPL